MGKCQSKYDASFQETSIAPTDTGIPMNSSGSAHSRRHHSEQNQIQNQNRALTDRDVIPSHDASYDKHNKKGKGSNEFEKKSTINRQHQAQAQSRLSPNSPKKYSDPKTSKSRNKSKSFRMKKSKNKKIKNKSNENFSPQGNFLQQRLPSNIYNSHSTVAQEWEQLCSYHLHKLVPPIDVTTAIEERISSILNHLDPTQLLRIQRRVRQIHGQMKNSGAGNTVDNIIETNNVSLSSAPAAGGSLQENFDGAATSHSSINKSIPAIASVSSTAKEKSKALFLKDKLIDETIFRSIFVGGDGILKRGWESDRPWLNRQARQHHGKREDILSQRDHDTHYNEETVNVNENENDKNEEWDKVKKFLIRSGGKKSRNGNNVSPERRVNGWLRGNLNNEDSAYPSSPTIKNKKSRKQENKPQNVPVPSEAWELTDPLGSSFLLLSALSENRWSYAAKAAAREIDDAGLQIDDTGIILDRIPKMISPVIEGTNDIESGISFSHVCLLMAITMHGTRAQKLLLLFHILLPPKQLQYLLYKHTFPTWILEESSDIIISLSSIYYYCDTSKKFSLLNVQACDTLAILIYAMGAQQDLSTLSSYQKNVTIDSQFDAHIANSQPRNFGKHHNIESILSSIRDGTFVEPFPNTTKFWNALSNEFENPPQFWTFTEFAAWANIALDDNILNLIFHRLFNTGILPAPSVEKCLVGHKWLRWQRYEKNFWEPEGVISRTMSEDRNVDKANNEKETKKSFISKLFNGNNLDSSSNNENSENADLKKNRTSVWGGLGGVDGRGGLGHGIMYIIEKKWWETWKNYVEWDAKDEGRMKSLDSTLLRPSSISNEILVNHNFPYPPGSLGSYFPLRQNLRREVDYTLVPPGVWDVLYEMYGGGPPLPRLVLPYSHLDEKELDPGDEIVLKGDNDESVEILLSTNGSSNLNTDQLLLPIPKSLRVADHPWILHCHLCDPSQPYRRGDNGAVSIRVMALPTQPLWRLFSEIIERLPMHHHTRAFDSNGKGMVRLWKKNEISNTSKSNITMSRFGPWSLLCKNRHAPVTLVRRNGSSFYAHSIEEWKIYTDNATVESIGLSDHSHIMLEFALTAKDKTVVWPREAAAKAGRERRLASEDASFRQYLRGLDSNGNLLDPLPLLVGKLVDAMDSTGRWYHGEIKKIEIFKPSKNITRDKRENEKQGDDESSAESTSARMIPGEILRVRVNFKKKPEYGEWINVSSDRLAVKGRCTSTSVRSLEVTLSSSSNNSDTKGKSIAAMANSNSGRKGSIASTSTTDTSDTNGHSSTSLCTFPGYGACGLTNLGNTCYANAALQCLAYLPLLRSYMLSNLYKLDLNKENPLGTGGRVLDEYADLLRMLWSAKYGAKAPSKFKLQLGKANSQFSGNDQQDAQELLLAIMDSLHEDSNKVLKKPMVPPMEDAWVNSTPVPRVGREAWWRYLRRNKSVIANTAMGQVMNRVTCPVCNHSSLNFDPFGVLSIPFPTVNEVVFQCILLRRGSSYNCPITLAKRSKIVHEKEISLRESPESPPSKKFIFEKYVVSMSRLADIGDLKLRLQSLTGISMYQLKLCSTNNRPVKKGENFDMEETPEYLNAFTQVFPLPDKPGPCFQLAAQLKQFNTTNSPSLIYIFENTLNPRLPSATDDELDHVSITSDEGSEDNMSGRLSSSSKWNNASALRRLGNQYRSYGDSDECVLNDSNPVNLSKLMSRNLWPKTASDFTIGLRVDANDQRKHWFPGSVVEIIDNDAEEQKHDREGEAGVQVKIHFDNFASKWDEPYTIDDFRQGIVRPLYSHSAPKPKPIEFMVYHRRNNRRLKKNTEKVSHKLFGHPFVIECFNEWSTARAGAHILAQASRFLRNKKISSEMSAPSIGELDGETLGGMEKIDIYNLIANESSVVINEIINILVESDRRYVMSILKLNDKEARTKVGEKKPRRNRSIGSPGSSLRKKLAVLLPRLPFEIRVCESDAPLGNDLKDNEKNEEMFFPFSLVRTIGNFLTAKSSIVLDWKDVSELYVRMLQKNRSSSPTSFSFPQHPILYQIPITEIHQKSKHLLDEEAEKKDAKSETNTSPLKTKTAPAHGGMQLGACLDEFCKELHAEGWACPECKKIREGRQRMTLWHLPDLLTFHIKRFNCSARWREKIGTKVNFPLTGLNMRKWCDPESPESESVQESTVYDLIGVINHYGGMTGGHYVAACKATQCSVDGTEEVAHTFSGEGISAYEVEGETVQTGWRLGRNKEKDQTAVQSKFAAAAARAASESSEPLWLQFDDDMVEPIPPENVVSETAYVLFYRRRRLSPANIARYTSLD